MLCKQADSTTLKYLAWFFMQDMVLQGLCELLLVQAAIGQIRAFVSNLIFVANTRFLWFVLSRLLLRH